MNFWYLLLFNLLGCAVFGAADWFTNRKKPDFSFQNLWIGYAITFAIFAVLGYFIEQRVVQGILFFLAPGFGSRIVKVIGARKQ